jgi:hypothetical protein
MSSIVNPTQLTNLNATSPFHFTSTSIPFAANTTIFFFFNNTNNHDTAAPAAPGEDAVQAITAWWPTANIVLGALGAVAALSLAVYQIRLARRQLHATHRAENGSSAPSYACE